MELPGLHRVCTREGGVHAAGTAAAERSRTQRTGVSHPAPSHRQDPSVECGSDEHSSITLLAGCLVGLWPLGSLVLYSSLVIACYWPLRARTPNKLSRACGFLHRGYRLTFYYWEVVAVARVAARRAVAA